MSITIPTTNGSREFTTLSTALYFAWSVPTCRRVPQHDAIVSCLRAAIKAAAAK